MKLLQTRQEEVNVDAIRVEVAVNYGEEDIPNDFPFRDGDMWDVTVDIATGKIREWPEGRTGSVHMKVCDCGSYYLMSGETVVATIEQDYVPTCIPSSYGDYIEFDIGPNGVIENWDRCCTAGRIADSFADVISAPAT